MQVFANDPFMAILGSTNQRGRCPLTMTTCTKTALNNGYFNGRDIQLDLIGISHRLEWCVLKVPLPKVCNSDLPWGGACVQYLASSRLANVCLPTRGCLRAIIRPFQLGSGDVLSHSFTMSIIQSLCSLWGPFMASRVPGFNFRASPILYQSALTSRSSVNTSSRSLGPSTAGNKRFEHNNEQSYLRVNIHKSNSIHSQVRWADLTLYTLIYIPRSVFQLVDH